MITWWLAVQYTLNHVSVTCKKLHIHSATTWCRVQDKAVVLDIGANTGFNSMLALSEGCQRVLVFQPQPACIRDIAHALVKNGFQDRAGIVPSFVDIRSGRSVEQIS